MCKQYNVEYDKNKFIIEFKDYIIQNESSNKLWINKEGKIKFVNLYCHNPLNIFEYMKQHNLVLSDNKYFLDIWIPLQNIDYK